MTISVSGGTPDGGGTYNFAHEWPAPFTSNNGSLSGSNLTDNNGLPITVTVVDASGCTATATGTIGVEGLPLGVPVTSVTATIDLAESICYNISETTSLQVMPSGGVGNYSYQWAELGTELAYTVNPLENTCYSVTVTDGNGCNIAVDDCIEVLDPLSISISDVESICFGDTTDLIASASGGNEDYTYSWSTLSGPIFAINSYVNNVVVDTISVAPSTQTAYSVELSDGCSTPAQDQITVELKGPLEISSTDIVDGTCDGSITNTPQCGSVSNSYLWSDGSTSSGLTNLCVGVYTVTVTDDLGATFTAETTINDVTGVEDIEVEPISIWTSSNLLHVKSDKSGSVSVYDFTGKSILQANVNAGNNLLALPNMPQGILLVRINTEDEQVTKKVFYSK
ncbi:MAG: T9SS type A sorting domain-containing protein [Flavobacteriales bacterium]|nr:T9SS type A sorting domain-containing protein [Flavobacteriales bacterium]